MLQLYQDTITRPGYVGLVLAVQTAGTAATWIGAIAVLFATINIVGGFQVTRRMLRMFRK